MNKIEVLKELRVECRSHLYSSEYDYWYKPDKTIRHWASQTYTKDVRKIHNIPITFDEFHAYVTDKKGLWDLFPDEVQESRWWTKYHRYGRSGKKSRYTKQPHHSKKVLTEEQTRKREWREKVKQPKRHRPWRYGSGSKPYCIQGGRAERRDMKMALHRANFDQYYKYSAYWEVKYYLDPDTKDLVLTDSWAYDYPPNDWDNFIEKDRKPFVDSWDWH